MDCWARIPRARQLRAVPLRAKRKEAVLRWFARQGKIQRHRNREPGTLSKRGQGHARPRHVAYGPGDIVCVRALLRPAWTGGESRQGKRQPERDEAFRETGSRLSLGAIGRLG